MSGPITNIAGYRFVTLPDRDTLHPVLQSVCDDLGLKGTVLLALEGINFFLAGPQSSIDGFVSYLEKDPRFESIPLKVSYTDYQPFNRMNVRRKKEIISVGLDHIQPEFFTGDEIDPVEFKAMLDDGTFVHVLDTRNDYELRVGTFENALDLDIRSFRAFPEAIQSLPSTMKDEPIVMFCTGGIRCEKASAIMIEAGFTNVKQLKGGILGYFEAVGGDLPEVHVGAHEAAEPGVLELLLAPQVRDGIRLVAQGGTTPALATRMSRWPRAATASASPASASGSQRSRGTARQLSGTVAASSASG